MRRWPDLAKVAFRALAGPRHNTIVRATIAGLIVGVGSLLAGLMLWARTPYARGMQEPIPQPIQFDHRHHRRDDAIDCRYCHNTAEVAWIAPRTARTATGRF